MEESISDYIYKTLTDSKNTGFRSMIGLQLINSGQSQCYITQMADVLSKNFSLPVGKVLHAITESTELYKTLVDLKIDTANALGEISENCKTEESKVHNLIRLFMGQEITNSSESIDEAGIKTRKTVKNKINPQLAKRILTHEILGEDIVNTEADLSDASTNIIRETKRKVKLMPNAEKERISKMFDTQQRACIEALESKEIGKRIISLGGAVRCGKSYIQAYYSILHIEWLHNHSLTELKDIYECPDSDKIRGQIFFIGKTAPSAYQNIFAGIFSSFKLNASLPKAKAFMWNVLKFEIRIIGYGKVSLSSLKGVTADLMVIDESEHLDEDSFKEIISRISNPWSKLIMTWNPKTPSHWLWLAVKDEEARKVSQIEHFNFSLDKCEFADKTFVKLLSSNYGKNSPMYKRFVLGMPASVSGQVYSQFQEEENVISEEINMNKYNSIFIGYDHGHASPRVYVAIGIFYNKKGESCVDVLGELYYPHKHNEIKRNADYLRELEIFYKQFPNVRKLFLPHDATDQKRLLEPLNYPIDNASRKLSVNAGIGLIQSLLTSGRLNIYCSCKNLINEFFLYSYSDRESDENNDKIKSQHDHALDALRYAIVSSNMFNERKTSTIQNVKNLLNYD